MVRLRVHKLLRDRGMNAHRLATVAGIPITTAYRLAKAQPPTRLDTKTIDKLCAALNCQPGDLFEYVPDKRRH